LAVTEPVPVWQGGPPGVSGARATASLAFVSLPPGAVPDGELVTVSNRASGETRTAPVVEGGFDPVAIPAAVGDTLDVAIQRANLPALHIPIIVPPRRPPIIVRTEPPKRKLDVPLSVAPYVVFSEPMEPQTVKPASVRLLLGGQPVAGTVTLSADGLRSTFQPDVPLRGLTEYQLQVTTAVTDRSGDRLEDPLAVEFTTESGPPPVAAVTVSPDTATLVPGSWLALVATVTDSAGTVLTDRAVNWTSSDESIAYVLSDGSVIAGSQVPVEDPGRIATVTATSDGVAGTAVLSVGRVEFASVSVGAFHTCALTSDGRSYCWGNNHEGHLGFAPTRGCALFINGEANCVDRPHLVPTAVTLAFASLSLGERFSCGLTSRGGAFCWGRNFAGSLGNGELHGITQSPVRVRSGPRYVSISTTFGHSCAVTANGEAYCWGWNAAGQLGNGSTADQSVPEAVAGGHAFRTVSAGARHTCGITTNGTGLCWGNDSLGQLGHGDVGGTHTLPTAVAGGLEFNAVSAGWDHTCGLVADSTAYCWGNNAKGQLGDGTTTSSAIPTPVPGGLTFVSVAAGPTHTCGLTSSGAAYCWGQNSHGQLGDGSTTDSWTPVAVTGGLGFSSLSAGGVTNLGYACGLASDSGIYCWGSAGAGNLGDGVQGAMFRSSPTLVFGSR
jgi:alpha-tubulin suppressor-like RCC1 family protein